MSKNLFQIGTIIPMVLQTISKLDLVESLIYLESQICPFLFFRFYILEACRDKQFGSTTLGSQTIKW